MISEGRMHCQDVILWQRTSPLLNQYSSVPRAQLNCWEGRYAVRPVGARVARAQIYALMQA